MEKPHPLSILTNQLKSPRRGIKEFVRRQLTTPTVTSFSLERELTEAVKLDFFNKERFAMNITTFLEGNPLLGSRLQEAYNSLSKNHDTALAVINITPSGEYPTLKSFLIFGLFPDDKTHLRVSALSSTLQCTTNAIKHVGKDTSEGYTILTGASQKMDRFLNKKPIKIHYGTEHFLSLIERNPEALIINLPTMNFEEEMGGENYLAALAQGKIAENNPRITYSLPIH